MFQNLKPPGLDKDRIRAYRLATGMTQAQAGIRLVPGALNPASRWSDYESGRLTTPDPIITRTMADILQVTPQQLLAGCLDPLPAAPAIRIGRKRGPAPQPPRTSLRAPDRFILRPGVLKSFRLTKNISMAAAAKAGGLKGGAPAWSAYEWGKVARPSLRIAKQLAKALGVGVSDIATLPEGVEEAAPLPPDEAKAFRDGYEAGFAAGHAEGLWQGKQNAVRAEHKQKWGGVIEAERIARGGDLSRDSAWEPEAVENLPPAPELFVETPIVATTQDESTRPASLADALAALNQTISEAATVADLYAPPPAPTWAETAFDIGGGLDLTA